MTDDAQAELLRLRFSETVPEHEEPVAPSLIIVARTVNGGSYPTTAKAVYVVETLHVLGPTTEGSTATKWAPGDVFTAVNIGSTVPPIGREVIVVHVQHRSVFQYD